jgi:HEAT repeat protein
MLLNLLHDAAPEVRAYATLDLGSTATPGKALEGALRDESPRVREAALRAIAADRRAAPIEPLTHLLADDPWTFVRVAAAVALSRLPASAQADRALGDAMDQLSPRVREQAMQGLGAHGAVAYRSVARSHLTDAKEDLAVRVASARSTGLLCDAGAVEDLTHFAVTGASSPDPDQVTLGLVALEALGAIHPKDLAMLLSPLQAKTARPDARAAAARALAGPASCKGP